jgi:2-(1,2-epoxy-1,2-dihydrophenyl)acetyl-CoA isomerase
VPAPPEVVAPIIDSRERAVIPRTCDLREFELMAEVEISREQSVLTIRLNRPDVLNALNAAVHAGLGAALKDAGRDSDVRAVVITGSGRGFCVGQDLTEFREAPNVGDRLRATYHPNVLAIRALEKPVIAAVNGAAAGAGLSLACACDVRIAADSATFVPAFVNIGLIPDSGGSYFIGRLLGPARAFEWMSSGRRLTAAEAHAWGLVSEVFETDAFAARTAELAAEWAALPTRAIGMTKRLFDNTWTARLEDQLEREAQLQAAATQTDDFREGVAAFLEKRPPSFRGA